MPFLSVMVEDGQPAQEPCRCSETMPVAAVKALEDDVAAILRHGGTHAGVDQFLDLGDHFGIAFAVRLSSASSARAFDQRQAAGEMLHDRAQKRGLQMLPVAVALGDGDEIASRKTRATTSGVCEQARGQGRAAGLFRALGKSATAPSPITSRPGRNFRVAGLGVDSVWMNMVAVRNGLILHGPWPPPRSSALKSRKSGLFSPNRHSGWVPAPWGRPVPAAS